MPIELQSDLVLSRFWHQVKRHMLRLLSNGNLADWRIVLRPKTPADDDPSGDDVEGEVTATRALVDPVESEKTDQANDGGGWLMSIDFESASCVFMFADASENRVDPFGSGELITSEVMACRLLDALEMAVEE